MSVASQRMRDFDEMSRGSKSYNNDDRSVNSKGKPFAKISEHLLEPTQSIISARNKLIEMKEEPRDDIWFSEKGKALKESVKSKEQFDNVSSKLYQPTESYTSFRSSKIEDHETKKSSKPISPDSRVLMPTSSFLKTIKKKDDDTVFSGGTYSSISSYVSTTDGSEYSDLKPRYKNKNFESRLHEPTFAAMTNHWVPKADIEADTAVRHEMELEEKARLSSPLKVTKPSERLLEHTVSSSNNTAIKQNQSPEPISIGKKVKEPSMRLLERTPAYENAKWKGPENVVPIWTGPKNPVPLSSEIQERLLGSTTATELSKYNKAPVEADPREAKWVAYSTRSKVLETPETEVPVRVSLLPAKKVTATSDRLLTPTEGNEHYKKSFKSNVITPTKIASTRQVSSTEHFLAPTAAYSRGKANAKNEEDVKQIIAKPPTPRPRRRPTQPHYITSTLSPSNDDDMNSNSSVMVKGRSGSMSSTISSNSEGSHDWSQLDLDNLMPNEIINPEGATDKESSRMDEDLNSLSSSMYTFDASASQTIYTSVDDTSSSSESSLDKPVAIDMLNYEEPSSSPSASKNKSSIYVLEFEKSGFDKLTIDTIIVSNESLPTITEEVIIEEAERRDVVDMVDVDVHVAEEMIVYAPSSSSAEVATEPDVTTTGIHVHASPSVLPLITPMPDICTPTSSSAAAAAVVSVNHKLIDNADSISGNKPAVKHVDTSIVSNQPSSTGAISRHHHSTSHASPSSPKSSLSSPSKPALKHGDSNNSIYSESSESQSWKQRNLRHISDSSPSAKPKSTTPTNTTASPSSGRTSPWAVSLKHIQRPSIADINNSDHNTSPKNSFSDSTDTSLGGSVKDLVRRFSGGTPRE